MMTRKHFFHSLVGLGLGVFGVATLSACSSGGDGGDDPIMDPPDAAATPTPTPKSCTTNGTGVTIGANHGHVMTVSKEDVTDGKQKTYNIQGTSTHPHTVVVTAAMFAMLKTGTSVMATSTTDSGHSHPITVSCA